MLKEYNRRKTHISFDGPRSIPPPPDASYTERRKMNNDVKEDESDLEPVRTTGKKGGPLRIYSAHGWAVIHLPELLLTD
jgi:hypothetical protein